MKRVVCSSYKDIDYKAIDAFEAAITQAADILDKMNTETIEHCDLDPKLVSAILELPKALSEIPGQEV